MNNFMFVFLVGRMIGSEANLSGHLRQRRQHRVDFTGKKKIWSDSVFKDNNLLNSTFFHIVWLLGLPRPTMVTPKLSVPFLSTTMLMRGVEGRAGAPVPVIWLHHPGDTPLQLPPVTPLSHHQGMLNADTVYLY